jgi:hypothetical protein
MWMVLQRSFDLLRTVRLKGLHFKSAIQWYTHYEHPVLISSVCDLDVPRVKTVLIQHQNKGIFFRWLHDTEKNVWTTA